MRGWVAYVHDMYALFNPAIHCDPESDGFTYSDRQAAGEVMTITIERPQRGWAVLHPDHPRYVIVSWSDTGLPQHAQVIARGRMVGIPGDMFGRTQTIEIVCAPVDLMDVADKITGRPDGPVLRFAKQHLMDGPETCILMSDFDETKPESYTVGRSVDYHIDAVTHGVSVTDFVTGDLVSDMRDVHFHDDQGVPETAWEEYPVPRARMKLTSPWTQSGAGFVNIAGWIATTHSNYMGPVGGIHHQISSLSPDFLENSNSELPTKFSSNMVRGNGWSLDEAGSRVDFVVTASSAIRTRRIYEIAYNRVLNTIVRVTNFLWKMAQIPLPPLVKRHNEYVRFAMGLYRFRRVDMAWQYAQDREDHVYLTLEQPIQHVPSLETEIDEGEVSTVDLTIDPTTVPYEPGPWTVGDKVRVQDASFVCNETHVSTHFGMPKPERQPWDYAPAGFQQTYSWHPYWDEVKSQAPVHRSMYQALTLDSGEAIIAHCMKRLRRSMLLRNRSLSITLLYAWEDAKHLTLKHSVRIEVPWHDGSRRAVIGKVTEIARRFGDEAGPTISITIGVSFGTGVGDITSETLEAQYNSDGYFPDDYLADNSPIRGIEDMEYIVEADRVSNPLDLAYLHEPSFAVQNVIISNEAGEQLAKAAHTSRDPREVIKENPTRLQINMRDLTAQDTLVRDIYVAGELLTSPRGIDLTNGDEP